MFLRYYQRLISKLALFIVLFASLAPTVSHALALHTGNSAFSQTLCTSTGKVVVIQVLTTKGSIITTELAASENNASVPDNPSSKHLELNLAHCPFCNAGSLHLSISPSSDIWLFNLPKQVKATYVPEDVPLQSTYFQTAHLSRAPPFLH